MYEISDPLLILFLALAIEFPNEFDIFVVRSRILAKSVRIGKIFRIGQRHLNASDAPHESVFPALLQFVLEIGVRKELSRVTAKFSNILAEHVVIVLQEALI